MSIPIRILFEGDKPVLDFELVNSQTGAAIGDITGGSAKFFFRKKDAAVNKFISGAEAMVITDGPNAKVRFTFPTALVEADISLWEGQIEVTFGSNVRMTEKIDFDVRDSLVP